MHGNYSNRNYVQKLLQVRRSGSSGAADAESLAAEAASVQALGGFSII